MPQVAGLNWQAVTVTNMEAAMVLKSYLFVLVLLSLSVVATAALGAEVGSF